MRRKVKISDIAKQSGVSVSTVSLALSNKPGVSEETRFKVYQIEVELDYPIKHILGSSKTSRLTTIGIIIKTDPHLTPQANPFYSKVIGGIEDGCRRNGINLLFANLPVDKNNHPL